VLKLKFSLIKTISFLLKYKKLLKEAINNIKQLTLKLIKVKLKPLRIFKDIKLKDT
jgi:hypothetical protein